jgi:plastocyanin
VIDIIGQLGSMSFSPNPASAAGRTVVFRNTDSVTHRIVLNNGSFDTGDIAGGATSAPMQIPGGGYHCSIHPAMVGTITN